jgi:hypothetical protein
MQFNKYSIMEVESPDAKAFFRRRSICTGAAPSEQRRGRVKSTAREAEINAPQPKA